MAEAPAYARAVHPWVAEGAHRVRFGVSMLGRSDWPTFVAWVQEAERLGFDSIWVQDHPPRYPDWGTTLAALAMVTTTIRLGTLVSCVFYRNPVVLAQVAADVDRVSGGRFVLGLGIGDAPGEFAQLGLPFPALRERQEVLEETLQIINGLWGPTPFSFDGKRFRVREVNVPRPVQRPHVPLLIAGGGERVTLRRVAEHADVANFGPSHLTGGAASVADVRRKLDALRGHCAAVGRAYASVLPSHIVLPLIVADTAARARAKFAVLPAVVQEIVRPSLVAGSTHEVIAYYQALVEAGMRYFIPTLLDNDFDTLQLLAHEVLPDLGTA
jgi:alkanesulfonate monooxygenase SsuD/methylene tetrahydromethanopterin reductase-like flavin-dependent oxidoreductase (luciferase family)